jgi:hypothetical protein
MGWNKETREFFERVDEMTQDMDAPAAKHLTVIGCATAGYIVASLSYFVVKGGKLVVKAIQNRH